MAAPSLRTDLQIAQLPATPNVGGWNTGKNTIYVDPTFGAQVVRLTDASSGSGNFNSMQTNDDPSGYAIWNTNDTMIMARNTSSLSYLFQFNPTTMQGTQLDVYHGTETGYKLSGAVCFSKVTPGLIYQCPAKSTVVNALTYTLVGGYWTYQSSSVYCDFGNILPGGDSFNVTWQGDVEVSSNDTVMALAFSNAGDQNSGIFLCLYNSAAPGYRMLDTGTLAVTQAGTSWGSTGTATLTNFPAGTTSLYIHGSNQPPNPSYTQFGAFDQNHKAIVGAIQWVNAALAVTCTGLSGHHGVGYLAEYTGGPGGGQYDECFFATPTLHTPIVPNQAGPPGLPHYQTPPQSYTGDQHSCFCPISTTDQSVLWVTNGKSAPFPFTSCWMGEVRGYDVTGAVSGAQGTVYRLCHTFNSDKSKEYITAYALLGPSQTGNFIAFNSDMGGAGTVGPLGSTSGQSTGIIGTNARGDVFIARIPYATSAPTITSANTASFTEGTFAAFTVNTTGSPIPAITETGSLPSGVSFVDNGNGTATLSGTPTASGTFPLTITAANGISPNATQPFTLTVSSVAPPMSPAITSANNVTFRQNTFGSFKVNTTGTPTPAIIQTGKLPSGITFVDNGNGTGTLSGTTISVGTFALTFKAENGVKPNATQPFTLTIAAMTPSGTVTATFKYPTGSPVANGIYQFKLASDAIEFSVACTAPQLVSGNLDANGNMNATLVFNDQLLTLFGYSTNYQLTVKGLDGGQVWNETYYLTGTAMNLNLVPPSGASIIVSN